MVAGVIFLGFSIMAVLITQLFGPKTKTADMKVSGDQETVSIGVDVDSGGVGHARSTGLEAEKTVVEADVSVQDMLLWSPNARRWILLDFSSLTLT